jgi:hypothetical protein
MKQGTRAANAALMVEILKNFEAADESTTASIGRGVTMQRQALELKRQEYARAKELRIQAGRLYAESLAIEENAETEFENSMRTAEDVLTQTGADSSDSAVEIRNIASEARAIPITSRKGKMQMVGQS